MVAADARTAVTFSLSPGQAHDAPEGRKLLKRLGTQDQNPFLLMDRAYEGNETRQLALALGFTPIVPPLSTRVDPWQYDREMYKRRNEIERLFLIAVGIVLAFGIGLAGFHEFNHPRNDGLTGFVLRSAVRAGPFIIVMGALGVMVVEGLIIFAERYQRGCFTEGKAEGWVEEHARVDRLI